GLVVVPGAIGELIGIRAAHVLLPERALHREHQRPSVWRPTHGTGSAGRLREIHLAVVVIVRDVDLVEHWPSLCIGPPDGRRECASERNRERQDWSDCESRWATGIKSAGRRRDRPDGGPPAARTVR